MKQVRVAVAVIINAAQQVLISWRQPHQHQGGLWEFPGGKCEPGETTYAALVREIDEEVGLKIQQASPLISLSHDYGDKQVELDVWRVTQFDGDASGREGQPLKWCHYSELDPSQFPAANAAIIEALQNEYQ